MNAIFDDTPAQLAILATTAYAMLLGGVIGFERELKDRPAGFRTHMLVAGAAALLVGLHAHVLAFGATMLTLLVLLVLAWVERRAGMRERAPRKD
ncbi:MgtC/SapB family protein [Luteimonas sp. 22616]|uniref:MgtC/SapB family protein n=1 Tax=Luteimonas sp. 22616 TaxID=3453951 RepID=UPI003F83668D